jgi:hypothetical protein
MKTPARPDSEARTREELWWPRFDRGDWTMTGPVVTMAALAAVGVVVWLGLDTLRLYGWAIVLTGLGSVAVAVPFALVARRHPLGAVDKGDVHRLVAFGCVALAGLAAGLSCGVRTWDAAQCWVGETTTGTAVSAEEDVDDNAGRRRSGTTTTDYDIVYRYDGELYRGSSDEPYYPGQPVEIVRPGGPICGDFGSAATPLFASLAVVGPIIGGTWMGRVIGTAQAGRRRRDDETASAPADRTLD